MYFDIICVGCVDARFVDDESRNPAVGKAVETWYKSENRAVFPRRHLP